MKQFLVKIRQDSYFEYLIDAAGPETAKLKAMKRHSNMEEPLEETLMSSIVTEVSEVEK